MRHNPHNPNCKCVSCSLNPFNRAALDKLHATGPVPGALTASGAPKVGSIVYLSTDGTVFHDYNTLKAYEAQTSGPLHSSHYMLQPSHPYASDYVWDVIDPRIPEPKPVVSDECVTGLRFWRVVNYGSLNLLSAMTVQNSVWPVAKPMQAHKAIPFDQTLSDAYVGLHAFTMGASNAFHTYIKTQRDYWDRQEKKNGGLCEPTFDAVGTAALWGRVVEYERGYRAEFGYPKSLSIKDSRCDPAVLRSIANLYGCEIS